MYFFMPSSDACCPIPIATLLQLPRSDGGHEACLQCLELCLTGTLVNLEAPRALKGANMPCSRDTDKETA
jgi:hypothetical protein